MSAGHPWMKFYPRDWRGEQALRAVSIGARGLWIECICIMHEAKPYGHLMLNGEPVEDATLASMSGVPVDEVSALMAELRKAGVFSVTRKGVVFSRRMVADFARAQKGRKAVLKRYPQGTEIEEENATPNRYPNRSPITQKPEARSQKEKDQSEDTFPDWYTAYPKHVGRGQAEKAYRQALKKAEPSVLLSAAQRFAVASAGKDPQFIAHPATWLNGERWLDDAAPPAAQPAPSTHFKNIIERYGAAS